MHDQTRARVKTVLQPSRGFQQLGPYAGLEGRIRLPERIKALYDAFELLDSVQFGIVLIGFRK